MQAATPDEKLSAVAKPQLTLTPRLNFSADDTLVVCAGFEDRSLASVKHIDRGNECHLIIVEYLPFLKNNRKAEMVDWYQQATGLTPESLCYDRENPGGFGLRLVKAVTGRRGRVFIDVSAMSRLLIVQSLVALGSRPEGFGHCSVVYCEAQKYPPTQAEAQAAFDRIAIDPTFSALFLSAGVFDVTIVPELSSVALAATQTRLIAFPGFDAHHLTALRSELQPSRFTFLEGIPPSAENAWRRDFIARINRLDESDGERRRASTLDYAETLDLLLELYRDHSLRDRLLVAPTGSKMQSVAVGIFRAFMRDVQIVYPTPQIFISPENYTVGVGPLYTLPLDVFTADKSVKLVRQFAIE